MRAIEVEQDDRPAIFDRNDDVATDPFDADLIFEGFGRKAEHRRGGLLSHAAIGAAAASRKEYFLGASRRLRHSRRRRASAHRSLLSLDRWGGSSWQHR